MEGRRRSEPFWGSLPRGDEAAGAGARSKSVTPRAATAVFPGSSLRVAWAHLSLPVAREDHWRLPAVSWTILLGSLIRPLTGLGWHRVERRWAIRRARQGDSVSCAGWPC